MQNQRAQTSDLSWSCATSASFRFHWPIPPAPDQQRTISVLGGVNGGNGRGLCTPREPCQRVKCPPCGCRRKTSGRFCLFKCLHNVESCQSRPLFELRARVFVLIVGALKSGEGSEYVLWGVCGVLFLATLSQFRLALRWAAALLAVSTSGWHSRGQFELGMAHTMTCNSSCCDAIVDAIVRIGTQ